MRDTSSDASPTSPGKGTHMNIDVSDKLGALWGLGWLVDLPFYGVGLYLMLPMFFLLGFVIEHRRVRLLRQYPSVKIGSLMLGSAILVSLWSVDTLMPTETSFWFQQQLFHIVVLVAAVSIAVCFKYMEFLELRNKRLLWYILNPSIEVVDTTWLNTQHTKKELHNALDVLGVPKNGVGRKQVNRLRFGAAYNRMQQRSATSIWNSVAMALMIYLTVVSVSAAFTVMIHPAVKIPAGGAPLLAIIAFLVAYVFFLRADNTAPRPDLQFVHPDTPWFPRWRRGSKHEQALKPYTHNPYGPDGTEEPENHFGSSLAGVEFDDGHPQIDPPQLPPVQTHFGTQSVIAPPGAYSQPSFGRVRNEQQSGSLDGPSSRGVQPYTQQSGTLEEPEPLVQPYEPDPDKPVVDATQVVPKEDLQAAIRAVDGVPSNPDDDGIDLLGSGTQSRPTGPGRPSVHRADSDDDGIDLLGRTKSSHRPVDDDGISLL